MRKAIIVNPFTIVVTIGVLFVTGLIYFKGFKPGNWGLYTTVILLCSLICLYRWAQQAAASSKEITLVAALAAVAAVGRLPFAALPGVQPTTFLVIASGYVFGSQVGFIVGATAALVSNFFLGQGPWTPWQMLGWGLVGCSGAYINKYWPAISRWMMALFAGIWGFVFGWLQNLGFWIVYIQPLTFKSFLAAYAASFYFDLAHAVSNIILCILFFPSVIKVLEDYKMRLHHSYAEVPAAGENFPTDRQP